jgi:hypothetical protein
MQEFVEQQQQFNDRMQEFVEQQQQFNDRMQEFVEQQREFNDRMQGFVEQQQGFNERQQGFNDRMQGFVEQQQGFNERQQGFNDRMQGFVEQQQGFNDRQQGFNDRQQGFNERQQGFNDRFEARMDRIEGDISVVKGGHARSRGVEAAPDIADDLSLEYVRTLSRVELVTISRALTDSDITTGDRRSFRDADLMIEAADGATTVYVAVEISYTADRRDSDRAERNARYLAQHMNLPAHAAVASVRNDRELQDLIDAGNIHWHQLAERDPRTA